MGLFQFAKHDGCLRAAILKNNINVELPIGTNKKHNRCC